MRKIEFLSPTSIALFEKDVLEFYRMYCSETRIPKIPQNQAMAAGSGFDAYVKHTLVKDLFGKAEDRFDLDTLLTKQLEPHVRDYGREAGIYLLNAYRISGAYAELLEQLNQSAQAPRFEFTAVSEEGIVGQFGNVKLKGKPDLDFKDWGGNAVTLDWKVNGFASNNPTSPKPAYYIVRDGWEPIDGRKASRNNKVSHEDWINGNKGKGIPYNGVKTLEQVDEQWARQLAIYAWLAGFEIGSTFICAIDQLCGNKDTGVRIASHRCLISADYQKALMIRIKEIWDICQSGWIFRHMTEEQSHLMQDKLDKGLSSANEHDEWFNSITRKPY